MRIGYKRHKIIQYLIFYDVRILATQHAHLVVPTQTIFDRSREKWLWIKTILGGLKKYEIDN